MASSFLEFPARGVGPYPIHALPYLDTAHLTATVNDVPAAITVDDANKLVTLTIAASSGTVRISRTTPRDQDDRETQFLDLPSGVAGLTADLLDVDYRQILYILGEARDVTEDLEAADGMMVGDDGNWDSEALKIQNLAMGSDPFDLITKAQLDAIDAATTGLPAVTGADNDDGLFVSSGAWAKRTPAQSRTHLGLGTVAPLTTGVAANNVLQLDSDARYPAADGRNIDLANHALVPLRAKATVVKVVRTGQGGNSIDPGASSTWSQNINTRFNFSTSWAGRTELNNSSDLDGSITPSPRFAMSAGTWRIWWYLKARTTGGTGANVAFRITDNDDTGTQTVFYDSGVHRIVRQFNGGQQYYWLFQDELLISNASAFSLVFRWALPTAGANNDANLGLFFHKISLSVLS